MQAEESEVSTELCTELSMIWGPLPPARSFQKKHGIHVDCLEFFFNERGTSTEGPKFFCLFCTYPQDPCMYDESLPLHVP